MRTKLARFVLHAVFGIGLCATTAMAADYQFAPPVTGYGRPTNPYPTVPGTFVSSGAITAAPQVPPADLPRDGKATQPGGQAPGPQAPTPAPAPENIPAPAPEMANAPAAPTGAEAAPAAAAGPAEAGGPGMLGRADENNRFNLFDNNSAFPQNRIFFNYQLVQDFNPGIRLLGGSQEQTLILESQRRTENLYRVGGEIKLGQRFSISFEDQYIASESVGPGSQNADAWGDPEIMLKWALVLEEHRALSATFGVQPQVSTGLFELHEKDTRFLPGMLLYQDVNDRLFVQGGFQFGFSSANVETTFDWAVSAGYWLYHADPGCKSLLTGIAPQLEVYGQHVLVGSQNNPYDIPSSVSTVGVTPAAFRDYRNVVDATAGGRIVLWDRVNIGTGVSFPLTGGFARRTEFLAGVNFLF